MVKEELTPKTFFRENTPVRDKGSQTEKTHLSETRALRQAGKAQDEDCPGEGPEPPLLVNGLMGRH